MKKPPLSFALICVMILAVLMFANSAADIYLHTPLIVSMADMASPSDDNVQIGLLIASWQLKALFASFFFARVWLRRSYLAARVFVMCVFAMNAASFALSWEGPNADALVELTVLAALTLLFFWLKPPKLSEPQAAIA